MGTRVLYKIPWFTWSVVAMLRRLCYSTCTCSLKVSDRFETLMERKSQMRWTQWGSSKSRLFNHIIEEKSDNEMVFLVCFPPSTVELAEVLLCEPKPFSLLIFFSFFFSLVVSFPVLVSCHFRVFSTEWL